MYVVIYTYQIGYTPIYKKYKFIFDLHQIILNMGFEICPKYRLTQM